MGSSPLVEAPPQRLRESRVLATRSSLEDLDLSARKANRNERSLLLRCWPAAFSGCRHARTQPWRRRGSGGQGFVIHHGPGQRLRSPRFCYTWRPSQPGSRSPRFCYTWRPSQHGSRSPQPGLRSPRFCYTWRPSQPGSRSPQPGSEVAEVLLYMATIAAWLEVAEVLLYMATVSARLEVAEVLLYTTDDAERREAVEVLLYIFGIVDLTPRLQAAWRGSAAHAPPATRCRGTSAAAAGCRTPR
jgi:hypothetical protein